MCETSAQAHVLPVLKSVISGVAVTLEVSFERFQKIDRHLLRTRSVGIMEEEQARHRRSYYPDILLCRLMPVMVYDRESGFIHLYVVRGEDFLFEFKVKRS
mgnify:FL=1